MKVVRKILAYIIMSPVLIAISPLLIIGAIYCLFNWAHEELSK